MGGRGEALFSFKWAGGQDGIRLGAIDDGSRARYTFYVRPLSHPSVLDLRFLRIEFEGVCREY
jgi:hypothetical protein